MVHALTEAHRVLSPHGTIVDYRPDLDPGGRRTKPLELYCIDRSDLTPAGHIIETPEYYEDYRSANRAVQQVLRRGLFTLVSSELSRPRVYFRSLEVLKAYLDTNWTGTTMPSAVGRCLSSLLKNRPGARIVVSEVFRFNVLRKA